MPNVYPKRLIEVDLPIARISAHARREKSTRHGHISTLHIWWARRPLAACRAVILASLWPDPVELAAWPAADSSVRPARFLDEARTRMGRWATLGQSKMSDESAQRFTPIAHNPALLKDPSALRAALLDFIADFANWDNSTDTDYLETARALTQAAHEALGGEPGTRPMVIDPFAGGGSIPLEALRVGAEAFASDLNPIPVLLNKVVLEYIPRYGQRLADEVRRWGQWIKEEAEKELAAYYPKDRDGSTPIAYLWARTILSDAPGEGTLPVEVPLMRSLWLAKKAGRRRALRWVRDEKGRVKTQTVDVAYVEDGQRVLKRVKRPVLEIFEPRKDSEVEAGTVARGNATCPVTGYTTRVDSVRTQLKSRRGGAADARLFCVVTTREDVQGRFYRVPTKADQEAFDAAAAELAARMEKEGGAHTQRSQVLTRAAGGTVQTGRSTSDTLSMVPDEPTPLGGGKGAGRAFSQRNYGMDFFADLFTPRQLLALTTLARLVRQAGERMRELSEQVPQARSSAEAESAEAAGAARNGAGSSQRVWEGSRNAIDPQHAGDTITPGLAEAVQACLAIVVNRQADKASSLGRWDVTRENPQGTFGRQALPVVWDFCEVNPFSGMGGDWDTAQEWVRLVIEHEAAIRTVGHIERSSAAAHPLPDDAAACMFTDPPYYDAVPYSDLSDYFYVWLKRTLPSALLPAFAETLAPKDDECIVDDAKGKDKAFFEKMMKQAMAEGRRVAQPSGVGVVVFAHKSTAGWETQLQAMIDAGWIVTGSWPIDTEMGNRLRAMGSAALASSVHLVVRPRETTDGSLATAEVGEWREVLAELPRKMEEWMPRLAAEGVVGADAIFACLGPALEVFSRYSRVEKSSGEVVPLKEYLEHVWAAVSGEALSMIFKDADAAGLEPDARLTAMWLWTLGGGKPQAGADDEDDSAADDEVGATVKKGGKVKGFLLEFDAARKIAQGLGIHLVKSESIVEVKGESARLLPVSERTRYLFGKEAEQPTATAAKGKKRKKAEATLFQSEEEIKAEITKAESESAGKLAAGRAGATVLDRVHQSMLLFAAGRGEALKRFLAEDGIGKDARFWKLAQSLSALYPAGTDEKRWVDGVLARKKGLGF